MSEVIVGYVLGLFSLPIAIVIFLFTKYLMAKADLPNLFNISIGKKKAKICPVCGAQAQIRDGKEWFTAHKKGCTYKDD